MNLTEIIKYVIDKKFERGDYDYTDLNKNNLRSIRHEVIDDEVKILISYDVDVADWFKTERIEHRVKLDDILQYPRREKINKLLNG